MTAHKSTAATQIMLAWVRRSSYTLLRVTQANKDLGSVSNAFEKWCFQWHRDAETLTGCQVWRQRGWEGKWMPSLLSAHQHFSTRSHMRHKALWMLLKLLFPCLTTLTIETSFLSSSMSLSTFAPFFFFAPCSDVAVGSYLSLPACKRRQSTVKKHLHSASSAADMHTVYTKLPGRQ